MSCRCREHIDKKCLKCDKTFEVCRYRKISAKYCSRECGKESRLNNLQGKRSLVKLFCNHCGEMFKVRPSRKDKARFCSRKCTNIFNGNIYKGELSHSWRGGITPKIRVLRESTKYKQWRTKVYERDNYTCTFCGMKNTKLNADHIKPFSILFKKGDWNTMWDTSNGRTLCVDCHKNTNTYGRRFAN